MPSEDVSIRLLRGLLESVRGVEQSALEEPSFEESVTAQRETLLRWFHAQQRFARASLGLELVSRIPVELVDVSDYLVAACPTVGAGIECLVHHARLSGAGAGYAIQSYLHEGERGMRVVAEPSHAEAERAAGTAPLAAFCARFRAACGEAFMPVLWLRERPRGSAAELFERLGCLPELAGHDALFLTDAQWALANPRRDPLLQKLLTVPASDVVSGLVERDLPSAVQAAIVSAMHHGDPSIARVAMRLGLTPRTMQRRLEAAGLAFQDVLDAARRDLALRYLASTHLSLADIGALLAYADATAFGRAFRRWTGRTPAAYRAEQRSMRTRLREPA